MKDNIYSNITFLVVVFFMFAILYYVIHNIELGLYQKYRDRNNAMYLLALLMIIVIGLRYGVLIIVF